MSRRTARARDLALTAAALVGAVCLVATVLCVLTGVRPLAFRSGSMAPTIDTGALALAHRVPASDLEVGDVVTVPTGRGDLVTHRIVDLAREGATAQLRLQGDANRTPDPQPYTVDHAQRVFASVPWLGHLVGWATGRIGLFVMGLYAMVLLGIAVRPGGGAPPEDGTGARRGPSGRGARGRRRRTTGGGRRRAPRAPVLLGFAAAGVAGVVLTPVAAQAAPWTDSGAVTGTSLTARVVPAPSTFTCGAVGVLSVTFSWSSVPGATGYTLHYGSGGSLTRASADTTETITSLISGGTAWVTAEVGSWGSVASTQTRSYTVAVVSICS